MIRTRRQQPSSCQQQHAATTPQGSAHFCVCGLLQQQGPRLAWCWSLLMALWNSVCLVLQLLGAALQPL